MKKVIFALMLASSADCYSKSIPITWINLGWTSQDRQWSLSIHEDNLPTDSLCSFKERVFSPSQAITESSCWLNQSGFNTNNFHLESVEIRTLGKEWKKCVYIINFRNNVPTEVYGMSIGVDFEGNVHAPFEHPLTEEKIDNKKIAKCTK